MKIPHLLLCTVITIAVSCVPLDMVAEDESVYQYALSLYEQGEYETALEGFNDVVNRYEWSDRGERSRYYSGKCLMEMAELLANENDTSNYLQIDSLYWEAIKSFRSVGNSSDRKVESQLGIGSSYFYRGEYSADSLLYDSAMSVLTTVVKTWPNHSSSDNALLYIGHLYRTLGNSAAAIEKYNAILRDYSGDNAYDNALFEIGYTYYKQEEYDSSAHYHHTLYSEQPLSSKADNAAFYLGLQHYKRYEIAITERDYQKAQEQLDSALNWYSVVVNEYPGSGAYDNALFEVGDYYYLKRFQNENSDSVVTYFTAYCDIADTNSSKYEEARMKLMEMGVVYEK